MNENRFPPGEQTPAEFCDWVNARVGAKFQRLYDVVIVQDFPRNVAGKTLKRVMREAYWQEKGTKL